VAKGKLIGPLEFHSKIIEGTVRRYWIYVPAKYDAKNPPNLLVFQDGQRAINPQGPLNIPVVLDNLIAKGDIPQTLGIFITPGNTGTEHYPDGLGPQAAPVLPAPEIPITGRRNMMPSAIPIRAS
jgi:enterochelin esterase family protein